MSIKNFDPYDFSKKEINGVPIYYKNLPWAPCIHIRVVFNTGAFDDPIGKEGMSHFLEHMIFDGGSPALPDNKAIREWSKQHTLNSWNATTEFNQTHYRLRCLPEEYNSVLSGMKDMIFHSYFTSESIEHERKVITQEAWSRFLNEKFLAYTKEFLDNLYHGHDHARFNTALGWPDTIAKISQEDVKTWHKGNYGIGNLFIVLTGAVEEKHVESLRDFLKDLPKVNKVVKNEGLLGKPKQNRFIKTADEIGEVKEQVEISIYRSLKQMPYKSSEICHLFNKLISDLLNEKLRTEHSLCYGVSCQMWRSKKYTKIVINVKTDEKNITKVEEDIENIVKNVINKNQIERFNTIKNLYKEQIESQEFSSGNITDSVIWEISSFDGHVITQKDQLEYLEKVNYDDIVKLTTEVFDPKYTVTEIILPSKK